MPSKNPSLVIALGGNAISKPGMRGTISEQYYSTRETMHHVVKMISAGYKKILITHGNGPQIGSVILRSEMAAKVTYTLPIDTCVADTQGGMGYMIQQVLSNCLRDKKIKKPVITLITQIEVDAHDDAFENPSKPIGKFYTKRQAMELMAGKDWCMREDAGRGWRRVIASPKPKKILEAESIKELFHKGHIVIAAGGGGIPVSLNRLKKYYGVEAVIDKDLSSALLAHSIKADILLILTGVEYAYTSFGTKKQKALKNTNIAELKKLLKAGEFAAGSMKPKIEACLNFLKHGGKKAIITSIPNIQKALKGKTGTHIVK
ncbi:MAG: carbamate kinase [Pseudomonadota bacterium]